HYFVGAKYFDCVVCRFHVGDRVTAPPTTFRRVVTPTGSINLGFILRENLLLGYIKPSSWGLPTSKYVLHQAFFLAPLLGSSDDVKHTFVGRPQEEGMM